MLVKCATMLVTVLRPDQAISVCRVFDRTILLCSETESFLGRLWNRIIPRSLVKPNHSSVACETESFLGRLWNRIIPRSLVKPNHSSVACETESFLGHLPGAGSVTLPRWADLEWATPCQIVTWCTIIGRGGTGTRRMPEVVVSMRSIDNSVNLCSEALLRHVTLWFEVALCFLNLPKFKGVLLPSLLPQLWIVFGSQIMLDQAHKTIASTLGSFMRE